METNEQFTERLRKCLDIQTSLILKGESIWSINQGVQTQFEEGREIYEKLGLTEKDFMVEIRSTNPQWGEGQEIYRKLGLTEKDFIGD